MKANGMFVTAVLWMMAVNAWGFTISVNGKHVVFVDQYGSVREAVLK